MTFKPQLLPCLIIFFATNAFGQVPTITHVDTYINQNGKRVTISGSNFGTNASNLSIWFGAANATNVETVTDQIIEVDVPAGATYESISVTNKSTNNTAYSSGEFQLSFGGAQPIALTDLVAQTDLSAESGLFDVCLCDLDNDGKNDVGAANSGNSSTNTPPANSVALFRNTSSAGGSISFAPKTSLLPSIKSLHIKCGDLDGDGKKDLIVTEANPGNRVFILKNTSTVGSLSFSQQNIPLTGHSPKRVEITDLDLDGKPDVVITDQQTGNNDFIILPNTSSGATISFGSPIFISGPAGVNSTDGLAVQDLDGDNRPDIVVNQFLATGNSNVFVYTNQSTIGNFRFNKITTLTLGGTPVNLRVGDIDGDTKADIIVTQLQAAQVSVFLNQSTSTQMQFGAPAAFATDLVPWGIDLGDIDGDGKLDAVVASLTGSGATDPQSLTILNNTSTPGSVSFLPGLKLVTGNVNRHLVIGDIDGDSKPDITYTKVDDSNRGITASKVAFYRNTACIVPQVTPGGPMVVCSSFPITLESTTSASATYAWSKDGSPIGGATSSTYTPTLTGAYTVDITSDGCTKTSNSVNVTMSAGSATAPMIINNSPLCVGGTINISATSAGADTFNWTGPSGFMATGASISRGPYVPEYAGRYDLEVLAGGCIAGKQSTLVETISLPAFTVGFTGADVICGSDTKTLTASPNDANFTYQWADENGDIASATGSSYVASATGDYSFKAKSALYPGCPEVQAGAATITVATTPVVAFTSPAESCKDTSTIFSNQSVLQTDAGPQYLWEFGDGGTSTDENTTHTYTSVANLTVKLTASYRGNACPVSLTKPITISLPPTASITTSTGLLEMCDGDTLTLSVTPSFSNYQWSTSEATPTIDIHQGGTYNVQLKSTVGCRITISQTINSLPAPQVDVTAGKNPISLGEQTTLSATPGYSNYEWAPAETLDDATSATPVATPKMTTTYTVTVFGDNGCAGHGTLELDVEVDDPINLLKISNFFSPNADLTNPTWRIDPESIAQTCGVTVFDEKGMKVYEAKPYMNDWDGTNNGKKLPDGVYYYVIKCDNASGSKTGSITILR